MCTIVFGALELLEDDGALDPVELLPLLDEEFEPAPLVVEGKHGEKGTGGGDSWLRHAYHGISRHGQRRIALG